MTTQFTRHPSSHRVMTPIARCNWSSASPRCDDRQLSYGLTFFVPDIQTTFGWIAHRFRGRSHCSCCSKTGLVPVEGCFVDTYATGRGF